MRPAHRRALVVCLVAGGLALASAPTALAQDAGNATTDAPTDNATVVTTIDDDTVVSDYAFDGDVMEITIVADDPTRVSVMEAIPMDSEGGTQLAVERTAIDEGATTIELSVRNRPAAVISTPDGADAGQVGFVQAEPVESPTPPVPFGDVVLIVAGAVGATTGITIRAVRSELVEDDDTVERIA